MYYTKRLTFTELFIFGVFVLILLMLTATVATKLFSTSDGMRIGLLTKISYSGLFIKSYEGELNMGGMRNVTDNKGVQSTVANVWEFSCSSPTIAARMENLLGKEVIVKYHQSFPGIARRTSYDVVSVEEVKK